MMGAPHRPAQTLERFVALRPIRPEPPWEACLLPIGGFPVPENGLPLLIDIVRSVSGALAKPQGLSAEVFIQMNQLHVDGGATRLSEHAREWMPQPGLGVFPDREPPTLWTKEDFEMLPVGARPRPLSHQVFRVCGSKRARDEARDVMLGRGTILEIAHATSADLFLRRAKELLLPPIKEKAFRSFAFYVPLLDGNSVAGAQPDQLDGWLAGATAYIRESVEDRGILIASREPLTPILERLGGRFEQEPEPVWRIPIQV